MRSYSKKPCNQLYNYTTVLGAAIKCKPYCEITVEIGTQLKTIKITSNIFAVYIEQLKIEIFIQNIILTHCAINVYAKNLADSWHLEKPMLQYAKAKKSFPAGLPPILELFLTNTGAQCSA